MFHKDRDVIDTRFNRQIRIAVVSNDRIICRDTFQVCQLYIGCFRRTVVIEYHIAQNDIVISFVLQTYYFKNFRFQSFLLSGFRIVTGSDCNTFVTGQVFCTQIPDTFYLFNLDQSRIGRFVSDLRTFGNYSRPLFYYSIQPYKVTYDQFVLYRSPNHDIAVIRINLITGFSYNCNFIIRIFLINSGNTRQFVCAYRQDTFRTVIDNQVLDTVTDSYRRR